MGTATSLGHRPDGKWAYDGEVTACFDDMLARSIPQYDVMRDTVTRIALRHARPDTAVVDLGCSRGEALAPLEGVLVPVTAAWNEDMLRGCGFRSVDCFWRLLNFADWIAVK